MSLERFCEGCGSSMAAPCGITETELTQPLTSGYAVFNFFAFHHKPCGHGTRFCIGISEFCADKASSAEGKARG